MSFISYFGLGQGVRFGLSQEGILFFWRIIEQEGPIIQRGREKV